MSETELSLSQHEQAVKLHNRIMASASLAQQSLWEMCTGLKEMRDGKLYKEFGYQNFEDYCETEVGFNRKQAHKYISIVEKVNLENVHSSGQIGVTKLALLATVSEEQQHEISEKINLEETTVKQLKAEIDKLKNEKKNYEELIEDINADKHEAEAQAEQAEYNLKDVEKELEIAQRKLDKVKDENSRLERENEELRSRPIDVAVVDRPIENDPKFKEIVRSLERENMKRNEELEQQYREDEKAVRKMLEKDKQKALSELREEYEKKLAEQSKAESMNKNVQKFEAYSLSLYETFESLLQLVESQKKTSFFDKFCERVEIMLDTFSEMWEEI